MARPTMNRPAVDETRLAVSEAHFLDDLRAMQAVALLRPAVPPSIIRRLANHVSVAGCPLSIVAESYRRADVALSDRAEL